MKKFLVAILALTGITFLKAQEAKPLILGEVQVLESYVLDEARTLNIFLPQGYVDSIDYPVLYVLDGTINEDFIHICGLVQFFQLQFGMPEFIVVGIANVDRKRDFTFHTDLPDLQEKYPTTGHSELFIRFIAEELQPFIESHYSVSDTRYLIGQSLGGLLATEILLKHADLFTHYLIVSPSLWWDNESMLDQAGELLAVQEDLPVYVYVSVGKDEHRIMRREARAIYWVLTKANRPEMTVEFNMMKDENHATILHNSIYEAFMRIFPFTEPQ